MRHIRFFTVMLSLVSCINLELESVKEYTLTFHANGGSGSMSALTLKEGQSITLPENTFTRPGYDFLGWALTSGGAKIYEESAGFIMGGSDVTFYAVWEGQPHTVTFNGNGGTGSMPDQVIITGEMATLSINIFSNPGHAFTGWSTTSDGTVSFVDGANFIMGPTDVTLYAIWDANSYTVTFNPNEGSGTMGTQSFTTGQTKPLTTNAFTRTGYTFAGWNTASNGSGTNYANGANYTMGTSNVTLYAKWTINSYTVSFNVNGGTGTMSAQSFNYNQTKALTANAFTRTGYSFAGWATSIGGPISYLNQASFTMGLTNVTLYAKWKLNGLILVNIPAGRFQRNSIATNIAQVSAFNMSQYEITRTQFQAIMGTDPSDSSESTGMSDPVQQVNWYRAIAFCNILSLNEGLSPVYSVTVGGTPINWTTLTYAAIPTANNADWNAATATWTNNGYRLPTEMEWMWAAMGAPADGRGGATNTTGYAKAFAGSTGSNTLSDYAWNLSNSSSTTHPIGNKLPNEMGLWDLSGNVWEWCWDWSGTIPSGTLPLDYRGPSPGTMRQRSGGCYLNGAAGNFSITGSGSTQPHEISSGVGFRVVRN